MYIVYLSSPLPPAPPHPHTSLLEFNLYGNMDIVSFTAVLGSRILPDIEQALTK